MRSRPNKIMYTVNVVLLVALTITLYLYINRIDKIEIEGVYVDSTKYTITQEIDNYLIALAVSSNSGLTKTARVSPSYYHGNVYFTWDDKRDILFVYRRLNTAGWTCLTNVVDNIRKIGEKIVERRDYGKSVCIGSEFNPMYLRPSKLPEDFKDNRGLKDLE